MAGAVEVIDDLAVPASGSAAGSGWALISDGVMGGVSAGSLCHETVAGRRAIRMQGTVSLDNSGGFLQMARDLDPSGAPVDASGWTGIRIEVLGNGQAYNVHLRTADIRRPWESYRQGFVAPGRWTTISLPFAGFVPHRTDMPFRPSVLRRVGLVAIGRAFAVDLCLADIRFYVTG